MFTGTQLWYTVCVNSGVSLCGKSLLLWRQWISSPLAPIYGICVNPGVVLCGKSPLLRRQWIRSPLVPCHDLVFAKIPGWFCVVWAHYCGASGLEVGRGPGLNPSISICLVNSTIDRDSDFSLLHIILYNLQWNTQWWYCCLSQWTFKGTRASKYQYYMGY